MKRAIVLVFLAAVLLTGVEVFAQDQASGREQIQTLTIPILKVYPHRLGYKVVYNRTDLYPTVAYLPGRWFTAAAGKGEIMYSEHPSVPYMTIIWQNNEFDHVRLVVHTDRTHRSWGALPSDADLREEFQVETLDLQF